MGAEKITAVTPARTAGYRQGSKVMNEPYEETNVVYRNKDSVMIEKAMVINMAMENAWPYKVDENRITITIPEYDYVTTKINPEEAK
jgi:hypothetical protein